MLQIMCNETEALRSNQVVLNSDYGKFELAALGKDLVWINECFYRIVDGALSLLAAGNYFQALPGLEDVYVIDGAIMEYGMFSGEKELRDLPAEDIDFDIYGNIMLVRGKVFVKNDKTWEPAKLEFSSDCWGSRCQAYIVRYDDYQELVALFEGFYSLKGEIKEIYGENLYRLMVISGNRNRENEILWSGRPLCCGEFDRVEYNPEQNQVTAFCPDGTFTFKKEGNDWVAA